LDIGCGFGIKLKEIIVPVCRNIVGIDAKHAIDFCKRSHNFGRWFADDIENPGLELTEKFDLIISADVIEHLVDPDNLIDYIKRFSHKGTEVIISTPERDIVRGEDNLGPSPNRSHVREWNKAEFQKYLSNSGFSVLKHFLVGEIEPNYFELIKKVLLFRPLRKCQLVHCKVKY
jgi:SAM-dependent methyltransferase